MKEHATELASKKILVHFSVPPYGVQTFKEGLDLSLVLASFNNEVTMLFTDDAVWALVEHQTAQKQGPKIHSNALQALSLYDIHQIYVDKQSLADRQLSEKELAINTKLLDTKNIRATFTNQEIILTY